MITIKRRIAAPPGKAQLKPKPSKEVEAFGHVVVGDPEELNAHGLPAHGNPWRMFGDVGSFMTIDPGLGGTGWAAWSRAGWSKLEAPIGSGSFAPDEAMPWWIRCSELADRIQDTARAFSCMVFYMELPQFMESAGAGMSAARKGDLVKLSWLAGQIGGRLTQGSTIQCAPVPIGSWKGQLPKDVCHRRVMDRLGPLGWSPETKASHEMDAVGIGLFVKGFL